MKMVLLATLALSGLFTAGAHRTHLQFTRKLEAPDKQTGVVMEQVESKGTSAAETFLGKMVTEMIMNEHGKGPSMKHMTEAALDKMDDNEAMQRLDGKLAPDLASLVKLTSKADSSQSAESQGFAEASLQKARRILNSMILDSWNELDATIIECKEYCFRNRRTYAQVVTDLNRLGSQIANLERQRASAGQGIADTDGERKQVEADQELATRNYKTKRYANMQEITIRKNDLAVFDFILRMVRCKGSSSQFVQVNGSAQVRVCATQDGLELNFDDPKLQAEIESKMTPSARRALREALGQEQDQAQLLQLGGEATSVTPATSMTPTTTPQTATFAVPTIASNQDPIPTAQWKKCTDGKPDCGLLHDTMSLQWGKFKDLVDELQADMDKNEDEFEQLEGNFNEQLTSISAQKKSFMVLLAETISSMNADTTEKSEKEEQERDLRHDFEKHMKEYKAKITEIMFTNICAVKKVRNAVMKFSSVSPASKISDCDLADWIPGECSVSCDDNCPQEDPYACGGWQSLTRAVVVSPNSFGIVCPALTNKKKCNQMKCPVDCKMSQWTGWDDCTKECEGGVQSQTRAIITKPKNGGKFCDTVQESRSCNTESCDRDCDLASWIDWSPCSMSCGGGLQTRHKTVDRAIRGMGKCPKASSSNRFGEKMCNEQACVGDEICIAKQDLIISIDASGSLRQSGFEVLRNFVANLTDRYQAMYFGHEDMQVGIILFGNGRLEDDGTIAKAINVQPLTSAISGIKATVQGLTWQRGFTNMAQAFSLADTMLQQGGRSDAQSAIMLITDGKVSFHYQTSVAARKLKDKNIQMFVAAVTSVKGDELLYLQNDLASQPWETNFVRIPGLLDIKHNGDVFEQQIIAKFCPGAISPSQQAQKEDDQNFMMIHEGGFPSDECGRYYWIGRVESIDDCAAAARGKHQMAFSFGTGRYRSSYCYSEAVAVTMSKWREWQANRTGPACPGGRWLNNPYYDVYAIKPTAEA